MVLCTIYAHVCAYVGFIAQREASVQFTPNVANVGNMGICGAMYHMWLISHIWYMSDVQNKRIYAHISACRFALECLKMSVMLRTSENVIVCHIMPGPKCPFYDDICPYGCPICLFRQDMSYFMRIFWTTFCPDMSEMS